MTLQIRTAELSEIDWINQKYDEVQFVHSHYENEIIAIGEIDGKKTGIGRLVRIDANHLELGGMYVFEEFRNRGVAGMIVEFLLRQALPSQMVYCIPFEHLVPFYQRFGFAPCSDLESVPKELREKYLWCKTKYPQSTALLYLKS